jgi:hypothetical protein
MIKTKNSYTTGAVAIAKELAPGVSWTLREIRIHLSAAGTAGNLTVTLDSGAGAAYDLVILTQDMSLITNLLWQPTQPIKFTASDSIYIAWPNASVRTYGLEVIYDEN